MDSAVSRWRCVARALGWQCAIYSIPGFMRRYGKGYSSGSKSRNTQSYGSLEAVIILGGVGHN